MLNKMTLKKQSWDVELSEVLDGICPNPGAGKAAFRI